MTTTTRSRFRPVVTTLALAPLLAAGLGAAPVAGAQDLTDGGRLGGGSSQLVPDGVAVGSLGGPELEQVGFVDPDRYAGAPTTPPRTTRGRAPTRSRYATRVDRRSARTR